MSQINGYYPHNGLNGTNGSINGVSNGHQKTRNGHHNGHTNGYYGPDRTSEILVFYVNGKQVTERHAEPEWTLLYYLRNKLGLYGTKLGCAEGGCGACTVMISRYDRASRKIVHLSANACLTPVCAVHGLAITTVEGIGNVKDKLHPVQERIAKSHGSQCGFCTPGIVMSMYALLRSNPKPTMEDMEIAFQGNLCRCTGYRPIIEGLKTFTEEWEQSRLQKVQNGISNGTNGTNGTTNGTTNGSSNGFCAMGDACCKKVFTSEPNEVFNSSAFKPYDSTQEPIFPPKLKLSSDLDETLLVVKGKNVTWYRPTTLQELMALKSRYQEAKIVVGNTEIGVEVKFKRLSYPVIIHPVQVKELRQISEVEDGLKIGASVTLMELQDAFKEKIRIDPEYKTRILTAIVKMLHWFAGKQIRNVAAVGGNIMTGSPISDLNPIFLASGIRLNVCSLNKGRRQITMDEQFFTGYRRNVIAPYEILESIEIPFTSEEQHFISYKQAKRRDDDIAIVNMALNVVFAPRSNVIKKCKIAFGGMAPVTKLALNTAANMIDKKWDQNLLESVYDLLSKEFPLTGDTPGGAVHYRRSLTLSLFFKGYVKIAQQLQNRGISLELPKEIRSASKQFGYTQPKSSQYYQEVSKDQDDKDLIGRPIVHKAALQQATGEAMYCDDIPPIVGELYLALVQSTRAHAKIKRVDHSKALSLEGVVDYIDYKSIPEKASHFGYLAFDEYVFAKDKVTSQGQPIGAVIAVDQDTAQKAARMVEIEYEDIQPIIVTIEDAIRENSFFESFDRRILKGDVKKALAESEHVIEGEMRVGGQEHFYLEPHSCFAIYRENDELEVFCTTQNSKGTQQFIAQAMQIPMSKVNVRVKRLGGGFGGKECRGFLVYVPCAIAAQRLRKPIRCTLDRDEDMMLTGGRHPFLFKYKIGFNNDGLIKVVDMKVYSNGGYSLDLSSDVLERAVSHICNTYKIPVCDIYGRVCKTNLPSNTAFRGFGAPQAMLVGENYIRQIADYLGRDLRSVVDINMFREGEITHYNQTLVDCTVRRCYDECYVFSDFEQKLNQVECFNRANRYRKRGIALVPTMYGICFNSPSLMQAGALVHIYVDGSVGLFHGGIEMGQGLHTKMIQVASRILKVNPDKIHTLEMATDKVPNASSTAASTGSDLNGGAVVDACTKIMKRLKPIMDANPNSSWEDWINVAYLERISLSATGFYKTPDIGYSFETNSGKMYVYYTIGTGCSTVEIDCLTGDHKILNTNIVMDVGQSLNPAIDIGQIEGAFTQGYGLFTMEELIYSPTGTLMSRGPGAYKIPSFADIPEEFNVSLLKGHSNTKAVFSSKAIGEPPLFMAASVFYAIKYAIKAARKDNGITGYFRLDSPATSARIRLACVDHLTEKATVNDGKQPWNVIP